MNGRLIFAAGLLVGSTTGAVLTAQYVERWRRLHQHLTGAEQ